MAKKNTKHVKVGKYEVSSHAQNRVAEKSRNLKKKDMVIKDNSNDREAKRLSKKQLKDIENAETLDNIKENSLEPKKFKRVALGAGRGIRTPVGFHPNGFQDRLVMTASIRLQKIFNIYAYYYTQVYDKSQ